jgi:hypothetical protein
MFQIDDYISNKNKETNRGECRVCGVSVYWSRIKLCSHKRSSCLKASEEEKNFFKSVKLEHRGMVLTHVKYL